MTPRDLARVFLNKALQDEQVVDKLIDDRAISDEAIGFHCQQAAEKLLKSLLIDKQILFRRTHDLTELAGLLEENGINLPNLLIPIKMLTPFAVEWRYDEYSLAAGQLFDRHSARDLVKKLRTWVESRMPQRTS